ncbi:MAG: hypothetical protein HYZ17_08495 [Betaproteobacteria bacterium]|nr:hypothetical protein [Betaproteobacteria bacterium]
MSASPRQVRDKAIARIARLFQLSAADIRPDMKFGEDLCASFVSDFRHNELDQVLHDIRDVADREICKELDAGAIIILTVGDYCEHMARCYRTKPTDVAVLLGLQNGGD